MTEKVYSCVKDVIKLTHLFLVVQELVITLYLVVILVLLYVAKGGLMQPCSVSSKGCGRCVYK